MIPKSPPPLPPRDPFPKLKPPADSAGWASPAGRGGRTTRGAAARPAGRSAFAVATRSGFLGLFGILLGASAAPAQQPAAPVEPRRPNVILLIADDVSWDDYGAYGNTAARTPHIDALARRGRLFAEAYLTASSCSPSRSSIITGRYPHNNGKAAELHRAIAGELPWFPELLRAAGYYTAIVGKHHMKSEAGARRPAAFDLIDGGRVPGNSGGHGKWAETVRERPRDKPFFFWFAAYDAHRDWDGDREWDAEKYGPPHDEAAVTVPPFLVDSAATRRDLASYYNEVTRFDHYVGEVVAELRRQGELERTLLLVMADNGRPFPRAKTRLHDSGMKTALIAHWPAGIAAAGPSDSLVSAVDLAPTILDLAGLQPAPTMQGVSFRAALADPAAPIRNFAFSEHNWHDYEAHGRSVRSADGYLLIHNSRPRLPWQGPADSVRSPSHKQLQAARDAGALTPPQADVFLAPRPVWELYHAAEDPDQLQNLAGRPEHAEAENKLRRVLQQWSEQTGDSVPARLSPDTFDRETGAPLRGSDRSRQSGTTPGEDRGAAQINASGPR